MKKKIISFALVVAVSAFMLPGKIRASFFLDMPDNWSRTALENAVTNQLLYGSDGLILPEGILTRAQMAAIINRAFGATEKADLSGFSDIPADKWYKDDLAIAVQMGILVGNGDGSMTPDKPISREEAYAVLSRAFEITEKSQEAINHFADVAEVSTYLIGPVSGLVSGGYTLGLPSNKEGLLSVKAPITRAEFAKVMDNLAKVYVSGGEYSHSLSGNLVVNKPDTTLKNMVIRGDLIIGDGVGNGDVNLIDVIVTGKTLIRGGGANSINIEGRSALKGDVVVAKKNEDPLSIKVKGEQANLSKLVLKDGSLQFTGSVDTLDVEGSATLSISKGNIGTLIISAPNTKLLMDTDSVLQNLAVNAANASLELAGTVKTLVVETTANNTIVHTAPTAKLISVEVNASGVSVTGKGQVAKVTANVPDLIVSVSNTLIENLTLVGPSNPLAAPYTPPSSNMNTEPSNTPDTGYNPIQTPSASSTPVPGPSQQPTAKPSVSPSVPPTVSPTASPSISPSVSPSPSVTPTPSVSPTPTPSIQPPGTPTPTPSIQPSGTPTPTPSIQPSGTPTPTPTIPPSESPTPTPSLPPSETPTPTPPPSSTPLYYTLNSSMNTAAGFSKINVEGATSSMSLLIYDSSGNLIDGVNLNNGSFDLHTDSQVTDKSYKIIDMSVEAYAALNNEDRQNVTTIDAIKR